MLIVWVGSRLPFPLESGGQIRTYHVLRELNRRHTVYLVTLADPLEMAAAAPGLSEICKDFVAVSPPKKRKGLALYLDAARHLFDPVPYVISKYDSEELRTRLAETLHRYKPDLVICDYLDSAIYLAKRNGMPTLIFEHNVEAMIWERLASQETNWLKRFYLKVEARKMSRFERNTLHRFDGCVSVSNKDSDFFRTHLSLKAVYSIPTGVDTDYFRPVSTNDTKGSEMVFLGSMDWIPNQDGVFYFVHEVFNLIRQQIPGATLTVVGRRPPESVTQLAREISGISVTGTVGDVRPYVQRARVSIVPLRVGGGTRIKIFEAMASGIPVVSTTIGAEGLPVEHGKELLLADTPQDFASACIRVLTDDALRQGLSERGRKLVEDGFSWRKVGDEFERICFKILGNQKNEY